jgi:carboxymethylenebutenolidase
MTPKIRAAAVALYDRFTHDGLDRRSFMTRMTALVGTLAAAEALIATIAADPAAAAVVPQGDPRLRTGTLSPVPGYQAYFAAPRRARGRVPAVLVVHENRGLNEHIRDVTRRLALAGYFAVAPDFLSPLGGTPGNDEDRARTLIGQLDLGASVTAGTAMLTRLKRRGGGNGHAGAIGFCWGGAFVNRLAVAGGTALDAGVSYYGSAPAPAEAAKVQAPLLLHFAGLDARVNATGLPWAAALREAGKKVEAHTYSGVNHAFNNDTSVERFDKAAAELAWERTLQFFSKNLR